MSDGSESSHEPNQKTTTIESDTTQFTTITTRIGPPSPSNDHQPRARLCHLKKWPHFQGYGFNLHAEKHKSGQHIGKVDANSPAESAGLREGDRIIEVNNVNISNENHQQVVKRIRNGLETSSGQLLTDEVILLVVDSEADAYFRSINVIVKSDFKNLLRITTTTETEQVKDGADEQKAENEAINDTCHKDDDDIKTNNLMLASNSLSSVSQKSVDTNNNNILANVKDVATLSPNVSSRGEAVSSGSNLSVSSHNQSSNSLASTKPVAAVAAKVDDETSDCIEPCNNELDNETENKHAQMKNSPRNHNETSNHQLSQIDSNQKRFYEEQLQKQQQQQGENRRTSKNSKVDPFQMSAAEFKTYLKSKGRPDPRVAQVDMRQKFQMFQDM